MLVEFGWLKGKANSCTKSHADLQKHHIQGFAMAFPAMLFISDTAADRFRAKFFPNFAACQIHPHSI
jgi:hypothetical protein